MSNCGLPANVGSMEGLGLLPERAIAECMLAVEDPLLWGKLGADSKGMVLGFARAVERAAVAAERERCALIARNGCLVPPDGGSPTDEERLLCEEIERRIRDA